MLQFKAHHRPPLDSPYFGGVLSLDFDEIEDVEKQLVQQVRDYGTVSTGAFEPPAPDKTAYVDMGSNILLIRHRRWAQETRRKQHWVQYWAGRGRYEKIRAGDRARQTESHTIAGGSDYFRDAAFVSRLTPAKKKEIKMWQAARKASGGSLGKAIMIYEGMMGSSDGVSGY